MAALGLAFAGGPELTLGSARVFSPATNLGVVYWQDGLGLRLALDLPAPYSVVEAGVLGQSGNLRYGLGLAGFLGEGLTLLPGAYLGYRWGLPDGAGLTLEYAPLLPYALGFTSNGVEGGWLPDPLGWVLFLTRVRLYLDLPLGPLSGPLAPEPAGYALGAGLPLFVEAEYRAQLAPRYTAWAGGAWLAWEGAVQALAGVEYEFAAYSAGHYLGLAYAYREPAEARVWLSPGARLGLRSGSFGVSLLLSSRIALPSREAGVETHLLLQYFPGP